MSRNQAKTKRKWLGNGPKLADSESAIQSRILRECNRIPGVHLFRTGNNRGRANALPVGWPDVTGWLERKGVAVIVFIEVKRPGEKTTPEQNAFLEAVAKAGGHAGIACCVDDALNILGVQ